MIPVSKIGKPRNRSLTPVTLAVIGTIGRLKLQVLIRVLLDLGSTKIMIHKCALSRGCKPMLLQNETKATALARSMVPYTRWTIYVKSNFLSSIRPIQSR